MNRLHHYFTIAFLWIWSLHSFAQLEVSIEPQKLLLGESCELILKSDDTHTQEPPNLSPLQHFFDIEATAHQVSTSILNGHIETSSEWHITLRPKQSGQITLPSLSLGNEHTPPFVITVETQNPEDLNDNDDDEPTLHTLKHQKRVQLQTILSHHDTYLHQEIIYTVRLIHQDQLLNAQYEPPTLENALIFPLGEPKQQQLIQNHQIFTVEEQQYAIFPEQTGTPFIHGPLLEALIYHGFPQHVKLRGKIRSIQVKAPPSSYPSSLFLPAKALSFSETYDTSETTLKLGQTLKRTLKIEATGLPPELLPTFEHPVSKKFSTYPEKAQTHHSISQGHLVGLKTITIQYLLNQPGTITLPSYHLTWFNTNTKRIEHITLPARKLHVLGTLPVKKSVSPSHTQPLKSPHSNLSTPHTHPIPWHWILSISLVIVIITLGCLYINHHLRISRASYNRKKLKKACLNHDPHAAKTALLAWAHHQWPHQPMTQLATLKAKINDPIWSDTLDQLSEALYAPTPLPWNGAPLWHLVRHYRHKHTQHTPSSFSINPS